MKTYDYYAYLTEISRLIENQSLSNESKRLRSIIQHTLADVDYDLYVLSLLKSGSSSSKRRRLRKKIANIHLKKNILQGLL